MKLTTLILVFGPILLLSPYISDRIHAISVLIFDNSPSKFERVSAFRSHEIKFADRIKYCEDALLIEDKGLAVLSCDPGRDKYNPGMGIFLPGSMPKAALWIYDYATPTHDVDPLNKLEFEGFTGDFHPMGVAYHGPSSTVFVVNQSTEGSRIEAFTLDLAGERPMAKHKRTITHPLISAPNSVTFINENELYVTNIHYFPAQDHPHLSLIETHLAIPGGSVVHIDLSTDTYRTVARLPFANGVKLINSTTLAVASSTTVSVKIYSIDPTTRDLTFRSSFGVPFGVDNLSVDKDGKLLAAGIPHIPSFQEFFETRELCNSDEGRDAEVCKTAVAGTSVVEWTEEGGLKKLYSGTDYPTGATAVRDVQRKTGIIVGLYANGIMEWKE